MYTRGVSMKLNLVTLGIVLVGVMAVVVHFRGQPWTPWHIAGLAIMAPSFFLFVLARLQLGKAFSVTAKASTLVKTGIYAYVRNPIYVFGGLLIAGAILWLHRPWWLLVFLVLVPLQIVRVRHEEQALEAKFGEEFREYKRQAWF